jgi:hypothetical protein
MRGDAVPRCATESSPRFRASQSNGPWASWLYPSKHGTIILPASAGRGLLVRTVQKWGMRSAAAAFRRWQTNATITRMQKSHQER